MKIIKLLFNLSGMKVIMSYITTIILIPFSYFNMKKNIKKDIWLISDRTDGFNDNGYWLFKYIIDNNLHTNTYYISKRIKEQYKKNIIKPHSLKHYVFFIRTTKCISSHNNFAAPGIVVANKLKNAMPIKKKYIYLGHGILKCYLEHLMNNKIKADAMILDSEKEKEYYNLTLNYNKDILFVTGRPRTDNLYENDIEKMILIMPTNRVWIGKVVKNNINKKKFLETKFYTTYQSLLNNKKLIEFINKNNIKLVFLLHPNTIAFREQFYTQSKNIEIAINNVENIQQYLKKTQLLITDYSSVAFDVAYMQKPVIYYQFDVNRFRKQQYAQAWFSYENAGFGNIIYSEDKIILKIELKKYINIGIKIIVKEHIKL